MSNFEKDDLMLKEQFQKNYQDIKLPDELRQAVLSEMKKEAEQSSVQTKEPQNKNQSAMKGTFIRRKKKVKIWQIGTAAAALCAAALVLFIVKPTGISYVTPMEEGVYYDTVELKDGEIHFVKNRVAISITPNAGQVVIGGDFVIDKEDEQEIKVLEETQSEGGGKLLFQETEQVSLPEIAEDNWSNIGEQMIYVTVLKTEEVRYQAVFEQGGTVYEVVGTDVTQKEFIDYLYEKINE